MKVKMTVDPHKYNKYSICTVCGLSKRAVKYFKWYDCVMTEFICCPTCKGLGRVETKQLKRTK